MGDAPLTAEELPQLRPLYKDFMYWSRDLHLLRVPVEVPPQYTLVAVSYTHLGHRDLVLCTGYFECDAAYRTH